MGTLRDRGVGDSLELELQVVGSHLMWVLRTNSGLRKPRSHLSSLPLPFVYSPGSGARAWHYPQTSPEATPIAASFQ